MFRRPPRARRPDTLFPTRRSSDLPQQVRQLAETYYGVIPPKDIPERRRVEEPPQNAPREVRLTSPRVGQPQVSISYLAPSYRQATDNEAYALQRSEEHTSELQSLMRSSYAVFCLKKKNTNT